MALIVADRVKETTNSTGTGTYTLGGASSGFQAFSAVTSNTDTVYYAVSDGADFEVGVGTYATSGNSIARTTILSSSNSNAAVNWGVGTKDIFLTYPAEKAVLEDVSNNVTIGNNLVVGGTVDGRDVATDGTKLDTVETNADVTDTANVTSAGAAMKANNLSDLPNKSTSRTNLGVAIGSNVQAYSSVLQNTTASFLTADETKLDYITVTQAVSLDQMEIDIAALENGMVYKGDWNAGSGSFPGGGSAQTGWFYYVSGAGTVNGITFAIGDNIVATTDNASTSTYASNWSKHDQTDAVQAVVGLTGSVSKSGLLSALNVEDGADVTDTANVTSAGALMDSEVTNLAQVKAFDSTDYATAAQGTTANAALPKAGGAMTGAITTNSTFDGRYVATDGTKLDGIEASADVTDTDNVTSAGALMDSEVDADIKTLSLPANTTISAYGKTLVDDADAATARTTLGLGTAATTAASAYATAAQGTKADAALPKAGGAMTGPITTNSTFDGRDVATDGDKLDLIEANADVTDATNVANAGALMDSEVTNLAQVKAFSSADYATAAQGTTADAALPKAGGALTGAVTTNSTFDGRDVSVDGSKLDGIETGATADQTAAQIKTAYESNADTNEFSDAEQTKLSGIEASADVTDATNVTSAGAVMKSNNLADLPNKSTSRTNLGVAIGSNVQAYSSILQNTTASFLTADETKLDYISVTQAVDLDQMEADIAALANGMVYKGDWDASSGSFPGGGYAQTGWFYYVSVAGTVNSISFAVGDNIIATTDNASTTTYASNWSKHDQTDAVQAVVGLTGSITQSALLSALNVEDGADVTDVTNVTSAGALMDSEVTNLAQVKAFSSADYATSTQGTTADNALPKAGGALTGAVTTNSTFDGRNVSVDGSKLDGIAASANNYSLPLATDVVRGGIELFSNTDQTVAPNAVTATAGRTYGLQLNAADQAMVNVPWTNTTYSAGTALDLSETTFNLDLSELSTSTTNGDGDYFIVTDTSNAQRKLTKGSINNSGFNNDAGFTTNVGDITGVTAGTNLTGGGTSGTVTLNVTASPTFTTVTATTFNTTSDRNTKTDIVPISDAVSKVQRLGGYSFTFKDSCEKSSGVIAQEVQAVLPELVQEGGEGHLTVQYGNMVGLLIEAIKEQQAQIDALTAKLNG